MAPRSVPMRFATTSSNSPTSVWSPDGNRIAFFTKHDGRDEIHIAGMDGRADLVPTTDDAFKYCNRSLTPVLTGSGQAAPRICCRMA